MESSGVERRLFFVSIGWEAEPQEPEDRHARVDGSALRLRQQPEQDWSLEQEQKRVQTYSKPVRIQGRITESFAAGMRFLFGCSNLGKANSASCQAFLQKRPAGWPVPCFRSPYADTTRP